MAKYTTCITVKLSEDEVIALTALSAIEGKSLSATVRRAIGKYLELRSMDVNFQDKFINAKRMARALRSDKAN